MLDRFGDRVDELSDLCAVIVVRQRIAMATCLIDVLTGSDKGPKTPQVVGEVEVQRRVEGGDVKAVVVTSDAIVG